MKKVISFSLWGDSYRYTVGAIKNVALARKHYPGWICRFYMDDETINKPFSLLTTFLQMAGAEVVPMKPGIPKMMQRFLAGDDPDVERFISRDTDSRIGPEEAAAVAEWIADDTILHTCRAHPAHARPINGGLFGLVTKRDNWQAPNIEQLIKDFLAVNRVDPEGYSVDQSFLGVSVWSWARISATQHDAVCRKAYPNSKPFPVAWEWPRFMGEVVLVDDDGVESFRDGDWQSVPKTT
jgi:protein O-GlcNAc transferase